MSEFLVRHRASIYLTLFQLILAAIMMRPAFTSFMILGALAGVMILTREVAMSEGRTHPPTRMVVAAGFIVVAAAVACGVLALHIMPALMVVD